jgi:hypothetical protein
MADWPRRRGDARCRGVEPPKRQRRDAGNASVRTGRSACLRVSGESRAAARGESGASGRESRNRLPARQCAAALPLRTRPDGFGILEVWGSEWED